jgi:hypothetical protein
MSPTSPMPSSHGLTQSSVSSQDATRSLFRGSAPCSWPVVCVPNHINPMLTRTRSAETVRLFTLEG